MLLISFKYSSFVIISDPFHLDQQMFQEIQESNIEQSNAKMKERDLKPVQQYQNSYNFVINYLQNIIEFTKDNQKMEKYLKDIKLTCKEFQGSFTAIVDSFKQLHQKAKKTNVMRHGIGKGWIFLQEFFKTKDISKKDTKGKTVWFLEIECKLSCCLEFLHSFKEYEDITNSPKEKYQHVWEKITIDPVSDLNKLKKDFKNLKKMLHTAASAVLNEEDHDFKIVRLFSFGFSFPRYSIMSDSGKLRSLEYYRNPTVEMAQKLWNLQQNGAIREFSKLTFQGIKTNRKIYLPPDGCYNNKTDILTENPNNITVRILYNKKLKIYSEGESMACCVRGPKEVKQIDTVILHFHGGGFIAMSSRSMQIYTRKWANQLNIPVFSVDYRMPPKHPFPQAPYDCLLAYQFLINHVHKFMNVRPTNIILAGDSAGGNLCLSLTGLLLKHKEPMPKAIYMAYPVVDLRMLFTESKIYSMTDVFLWPSTLLLCLQEYLQGDNSKASDPLASPILISQQWIGGAQGDLKFPCSWPKTKMTVGSKDPLYDDSLNLMQRMTASKVDCSCVIYQELSHGYLNSDLVVSEAQKTVKQSVEHLRQLIEPYISKTISL